MTPERLRPVEAQVEQVSVPDRQQATPVQIEAAEALIDDEPDRTALVRPWGGRVVAAFRPVEDGGTGLWRLPELWSQPRPPLAEVVAYLKTAPWTTVTGVWRVAGTAYSWLAVLLVAAAYVMAWLAERPTRAGFATALIVAGYLIRF